MGSFKEYGHFIQALASTDVQNGGVDLSREYSVRPPTFRLRPNGQQESIADISVQDISSIQLKADKLTRLRLPQEDEVNLGMELEFTVIDTKGDLADLYGGDFIQRENGRAEIVEKGNPWLIDVLEGSPECLRHQVEINSPVDNSPSSLTKRTLILQKKLIERADKYNLRLLPTGLSGLKLQKGLWNIPPHPYLVSIHKYSIGEEGSLFDGMALQNHVDLKAYGSSIEHALIIGNFYNNLPASMLAGLFTSSPFWRGTITRNYSNREAARNRLATRGGIQAIDYPIDAEGFLEFGDKLLKAGIIPVPERAGSYNDKGGNGSHRDYRPKLSLGTAEFGACDMHPNPLLYAANLTICRKLVHKLTECIMNAESIPQFLEPISPDARIRNRQAISKYGNNARLITSAGKEMHIADAWNSLFQWLDEGNLYDYNMTLAQAAVVMSLDIRAPIGRGEYAIQDYLDFRKPEAFLRGNFSQVMLEYARSQAGNDRQRIFATNLEVADRYREFILSDNLSKIF